LIQEPPTSSRGGCLRSSAGWSASETYVPIFALGEPYFGAYLYAYKNNSAKYFEMYDDFRASYADALLAPNADTPHFCTAIRAELRVKGQTIQDSDMWIAALARQYDLTVATTDAHYARISALRYEIWP